MPTRVKTFDFESYTVQQLEAINKKLDTLNTTFVPREEIMLMHSQLIQQVTTLTSAVETHTNQIASLQGVDNRQQGSIEGSRRFINYALTVLGMVVAAICTYLGIRGIK